MYEYVHMHACMHMRGNRAQAIFCLVIRANIYAAFLIFSGEIISLHYQHMCRLFSAADILPSPHVRGCQTARVV
jgi:hypothetical protein